MGRKMETFRPLDLELKVPTFFRCPISLDVMRSPVSLSTGVTYDRSSIQQWLDSGRKTCPATNQPLNSTDLIPNLTLRHLIQIWFASAAAAVNNSVPNTRKNVAFDLLADLQSSSDPPAALRRLADFFLDAVSDNFEKNSIVFSGEFAAVISPVFKQSAGETETLEAVTKVFSSILTVGCIEERNKKIAISSLISDLNSSVSALFSILKQSKSNDSKSDAARILCAILSSSDSDSKNSIVENWNLIPELIRLINQEKMDDRESIEAGIECLAEIAGFRKGKILMVREGIVPAVVRILKAEAKISPAKTAEKAIVLLEAVSGIAEGRSAICEEAEECLRAVLERMMKVGREGIEAAVMVLWSVCYRFRDRRAVAAVAAERGGAMKILVLMQSNCSPAVRRMSGDLLKILGGSNNKSCLAGYETKTMHIMPF